MIDTTDNFDDELSYEIFTGDITGLSTIKNEKTIFTDQILQLYQTKIKQKVILHS